jgi:transcriptional regulator with XRE-family HTH domain
MGQRPAEQVAGTVRAELARRRISGRQLALALGWSRSRTNRLLSGQDAFDVDELAQVAEHMGLTVSDLIGEAVA